MISKYRIDHALNESDVKFSFLLLSDLIHPIWGKVFIREELCFFYDYLLSDVKAYEKVPFVNESAFPYSIINSIIPVIDLENHLQIFNLNNFLESSHVRENKHICVR